MTLVELMVTLMVAAIVIVVPLTLMVNVFGDAEHVESRTQLASRAQLELKPLVDDLRNATSASFSAPATVVMTLPVRSLDGVGALLNPASQTVTWTCTAGANCTRAVTGGASQIMIANVVSASFAPTTSTGATGTANPTYVGITVKTLAVRADLLETGRAGAGATGPQSSLARPSQTVELTDGVALRNFS